MTQTSISENQDLFLIEITHLMKALNKTMSRVSEIEDKYFEIHRTVLRIEGKLDNIARTLLNVSDEND